MDAAGLASGSDSVICSLNDLLCKKLQGMKQTPCRGSWRQSSKVDAGEEVGSQNLISSSRISRWQLLMQIQQIPVNSVRFAIWTNHRNFLQLWPIIAVSCKGCCHTSANSLPCFVQKTPQTCMCATNVSHLPTKITAKGGEKQYPGGYCTKVEFNKSRITEKARLDQV